MNTYMGSVTKHLLNSFYEIQELHRNKQYQESLPLIDEILKSSELKLVDPKIHAACRFEYLKAVALDMTGKSEEALAHLAMLVKEYPGAPFFETSLQVVCAGIERRAREAMMANPNDPWIRSALAVLERFGTPSFRIIHTVAMQEVNEGLKEKAWDRMQGLLNLSPNDADYLGCALIVASQCNMQIKRAELMKHIRNLMETQPYRLDLAQLLEMEGGAVSDER